MLSGIPPDEEIASNQGDKDRDHHSRPNTPKKVPVKKFRHFTPKASHLSQMGFIKNASKEPRPMDGVLCLDKSLQTRARTVTGAFHLSNYNKTLANLIGF
jgi:hypothetical protein